MSGEGGDTSRARGSLLRTILRVDLDSGWEAPAKVFTGIAAVMLVVQHLSNRVFRDFPYAPIFEAPANLVDGWSQFDGPEYLNIAENGYSYTYGVPSNVPWFPLYPNLIRVVHAAMGHWLFAALLISMAAGMAAAIVYWKWLDAAAVPRSRKWAAFMFLMLYPYGWYLFGVVHSDALFLALVVGAFLLVEKDRYVWAGVIGALATATRPTGLALIPGLFAHGLVHGGVLVSAGRRWSWVRRFEIPNTWVAEKWAPRMLAPLLSLAGVGSYSVYLWYRFGDPVAFGTNQSVYHREPGLYNILKLYYFDTVTDWSDALHPITMTAQAVVLVVVLASVPFVGRRFGWGYAVFVGVLGVIPVFSSEDFMGVGRYMMAAFPTLALFGSWLGAPERRRERTGWFVFATGILFVTVWGFSRSWYFT